MILPLITDALLYLSILSAFLTIIVSGNKIRLTVSASFLFIAMAFFILIYAFINSDYNFKLVVLNSSSIQPLVYRITALWGNHEGSYLLYILILSIYNLSFAFLSKLDNEVKSLVLKIQSILYVLIAGYIALVSSPFEVNKLLGFAGFGLNPLLEDIGLAIHPPLLYIGYVGFSILFSFALVCLIKGKLNKDDLNYIYPWFLVAFTFLSIGIGMGSNWAYRELGWGGVWFWDPVENVSLFPWLASLALLHVLIVAKKRQELIIWMLSLSVVIYLLTLLGFLLVRSGVLTSVHGFATDPLRGVFLLAMTMAITLSSLYIYFKRINIFRTNTSFTLFSKEVGILLANLLFVIACFTVVLGTIYPIILLFLTDYRISVAAPYYNQVFAIFSLVLFFIMFFVPFINWVQDKKEYFFKRNKSLLIISFFIIILYFILLGISFVSIVCLLPGLVIVSSLVYFIKHKSDFLRALAITLSHIGICAIVIGAVWSSANQIEINDVMKFNDNIKVNGNIITFEKISVEQKENFVSFKGQFKLEDKKNISYLNPEIRYYPLANKTTVEAAIKYEFLNNIYIIMSDVGIDGSYAVRVYYKPLVSLIWVGLLILFLGLTSAFTISLRK